MALNAVHLLYTFFAYNLNCNFACHLEALKGTGQFVSRVEKLAYDDVLI